MWISCCGLQCPLPSCSWSVLPSSFFSVYFWDCFIQKILSSLFFLQYTLPSILSFHFLQCTGMLYSHQPIYMIYDGVAFGLVHTTAFSKVVLSMNYINNSSSLGILFPRKLSTILQDGVHVYILITEIKF